MSTWAASAAISGGADAVISSVVSVEAATLGLAYIHVSLIMSSTGAGWGKSNLGVQVQRLRQTHSCHRAVWVREYHVRGVASPSAPLKGGCATRVEITANARVAASF